MPVQKFRRDIDIQVEVEDKELRCVSRMVDEYHDMELRITVDLTGPVISAVEGSMRERPFAICPGALISLQGAIGLTVAPGVKKAFREAVPRALSCAHMTEIADNTFDYLLQKIYWDGVGQAIVDRRQWEQMLFSMLNEKDTCFAFNKQRRFMPTDSPETDAPPSTD